MNEFFETIVGWLLNPNPPNIKRYILECDRKASMVFQDPYFGNDLTFYLESLRKIRRMPRGVRSCTGHNGFVSNNGYVKEDWIDLYFDSEKNNLDAIINWYANIGLVILPPKSFQK